MRRLKYYIITGSVFLFSCHKSDQAPNNAGYSTPNQYTGYTLVWSDEFSGNAIDENNWSFEIGNNNGWGNNELEYYTSNPENAFVAEGNLIIEAKAGSMGALNCSSARMITKGKKSFKYGRIDIRAKLPRGKGIWPALWMLGDNIDAVGWPTCGELDIMELIGQQPNITYGTLHWGPTTDHFYGKTLGLSSGTFADSFHVYTMKWTASAIELLVDDVSYLLMDISTGDFPFNQNFFFIFNIAVGGDFPGPPDQTTPLPQRMVVDYVRVFQ
jgi:beta-glucanase (GH16 family)